MYLAFIVKRYQASTAYLISKSETKIFIYDFFFNITAEWLKVSGVYCQEILSSYSIFDFENPRQKSLFTIFQHNCWMAKGIWRLLSRDYQASIAYLISKIRDKKFLFTIFLHNGWMSKGIWRLLPRDIRLLLHIWFRKSETKFLFRIFNITAE